MSLVLTLCLCWGGTSVQAQAVTFITSDEGTTPGEQVTVEVSVSGFTQVTTFQFSLAWDPSVLSYVSTGSYGLAGLAAGNFGTTQTGSGRVSVSWDDPEATGVTVADGTVVFAVTFEAVGAATASTGVTFGDVPTPREVTVDFVTVDFNGVEGTVVLPVELVSFEAVGDGASVVLRWSTASETNNAGFEVQAAPGGSEAWQVLGFVAGAGTTGSEQVYAYRAEGLAPGVYRFRLRQVDYDGTSWYSGVVEASVELGVSFVLEGAYPNPFNPATTLRFAVREAQPVRLELFDLLGRQVRVLYDGVPPAGTMQSVHLDGRDLPSGLYVVRFTGPSFLQTQVLMLLR